ncbi:hypothetical protein L9F63_002617 [Diploptera punctata]|uniref:Ionotropic glutamate receptor C-terminal domain-containing protein n=1 Tax=Diploptera punctata TaxID=6984 RepID=A0AAD7ZT40_DIPPU|nr:hypothetical protein L9F63_002617 [Diploptera punctata]
MTPVSFSSHNLPDDCVTSYPYFKYILSWYVHAAPIPKWKGIVMGFQQIMWFLVILAFIFGTVTFWLFSNIHLMKYITLIEAIMNSLRTYLGMSIKIELRGSLSAVFFTLWLCYCMLIYTAYQSYLIGFLTNPGEYSPINTEEELNKLGFDRWTNVKFVNAIYEQEMTWNSYHFCSWNECYEGLRTKDRLAVLGPSNIFDFLSPTFRLSHGTLNVVKINDYAKHYYTYSHFNLGCLFLKRFDTITHRLISSGIVDKWLGDITLEIWKYLHKHNIHPQPLNLSQLQGCIYLLIIGNTLGFIVFISEVLSAMFRAFNDRKTRACRNEVNNQVF